MMLAVQVMPSVSVGERADQWDAKSGRSSYSGNCTAMQSAAQGDEEYGRLQSLGDPVMSITGLRASAVVWLRPHAEGTILAYTTLIELIYGGL